MADVENKTALTKLGEEYQITFTEIANDGTRQAISVPLAADSDFNKWHLMLRAAILKKTTWAKYSIPEIIHAILYADRMGLDIIAGDIYTADGGRISTTAKAKIRHGRAALPRARHKVVITNGPDVEIPYRSHDGEKTWKGKNYGAVVSIYIEGWQDEPIVYETTLEEWFVGTNQNWRTRPRYMLRLNALSKAYEEVAPMGTEGDEAPSVEVQAISLTTKS